MMGFCQTAIVTAGGMEAVLAALRTHAATIEVGYEALMDMVRNHPGNLVSVGCRLR
jgi:hypothetical protein